MEITKLPFDKLSKSRLAHLVDNKHIKTDEPHGEIARGFNEYKFGFVQIVTLFLFGLRHVKSRKPEKITSEKLFIATIKFGIRYLRHSRIVQLLGGKKIAEPSESEIATALEYTRIFADDSDTDILDIGDRAGSILINESLANLLLFYTDDTPTNAFGYQTALKTGLATIENNVIAHYTATVFADRQLEPVKLVGKPTKKSLEQNANLTLKFAKSLVQTTDSNESPTDETND